MNDYEPAITFNGHPLDPGQAMAVRVAIISFFQEMNDPEALGTDEHGRKMVARYRERLGEVIDLMLPTGRPGAEAGDGGERDK